MIDKKVRKQIWLEIMFSKSTFVLMAGGGLVVSVLVGIMTHQSIVEIIIWGFVFGAAIFLANLVGYFLAYVLD